MRWLLIVAAIFITVALSVQAQQVTFIDRLNPVTTLDSSERYMVQFGPFNGGQTMRATGAQIAAMVMKFGGFVKGPGASTVGDVATYGDSSGLNLIDTSPNSLAVTPSGGTLGSRLLAALFGNILDPNNYNNIKTTGSVTAGSLAVSTPVPASSGGNGTTALGVEFVNDSNTLHIDASMQKPAGRLSLSSNNPVQVNDFTAVSTIFYLCYVGNKVPVYDGTADVFVPIAGCSASLGMAAANVVSGNVYDIFAVNNVGSVAIGVGPAWSSTTSRGTGAGTTQIHNPRGYWTNQVTLNHLWGGVGGVTDLGPVAADQATYLGSVYATANAQTTMQFRPAAATGGSNNVLGLYNAYNRIMVRSSEQDSTLAYTYSTLATWRAADNSALNRITFLDGLQQSPIFVTYNINGSISAGGTMIVGVDLDVSNTQPRSVASSQSASISSLGVSDTFAPQLGAHIVIPVEDINNAGTGTFNQSGPFTLVLSMEM